MYVCTYITTRNTRVLQQASLLADNARSTRISIYVAIFPYTNMQILVPDITSCDVAT